MDLRVPDLELTVPVQFDYVGEVVHVGPQPLPTYITHMRSAGERLLEGIDETIRISRESKLHMYVYTAGAAPL